MAHDREIHVSRLKHAHAASPTIVPPDTETIGRNDLVTVVGPRAVLDEVATRLGHVSSHDIVEDRHDLDFRRITLSSKPLVGHTVGELDLDARFGATVSRVRRGDVDLVAHDTFVLAMGDRLRVTAPRDRMAEVGRTSATATAACPTSTWADWRSGSRSASPSGWSTCPPPEAASPSAPRRGPCWSASSSDASRASGRSSPRCPTTRRTPSRPWAWSPSSRTRGCAPDARISEALASAAGWRVVVLGLVLTATSAGLLVLGVHLLRRMPWLDTAGALAGAQTQPAILAYVNDRTGYDTRIGVAYALVYPVAMITKIVVAQVLAGL